MIDYTPLLEAEIDLFEARLKGQLIADDRVATGKTLASIRKEVVPGEARLLGAPQFVQLQYGRGPTTPGAPPGEPTLLQQIKDWIAAKGLTLNPFAVTKKIHREGTAQYRGQDRRWPGRQESTTFAKVVNEVTLGDMRARLATASAGLVKSEILDLFK